jgi:hypothetical protein
MQYMCLLLGLSLLHQYQQSSFFPFLMFISNLKLMLAHITNVSFLFLFV